MPDIYEKIAESFIGASEEVATLYPKPEPPTAPFPFAKYFEEQVSGDRRLGEEEEEEPFPGVEEARPIEPGIRITSDGRMWKEGTARSIGQVDKATGVFTPADWATGQGFAFAPIKVDQLFAPAAAPPTAPPGPVPTRAAPPTVGAPPMVGAPPSEERPGFGERFFASTADKVKDIWDGFQLSAAGLWQRTKQYFVSALPNMIFSDMPVPSGLTREEMETKYKDKMKEIYNKYPKPPYTKEQMAEPWYNERGAEQKAAWDERGTYVDPSKGLFGMSIEQVEEQNVSNKEMRDKFKVIYDKNKQKHTEWLQDHPELQPRPEWDNPVIETFKTDLLTALDPAYWAYIVADAAPFTLGVLGTTIIVSGATGNPFLGLGVGIAVATPAESQDLYEDLVASGATESQAGMLAVPVGAVIGSVEGLSNIPLLSAISQPFSKLLTGNIRREVARATVKGILAKGLTTFTMVEAAEIMEEVVQGAIHNATVKTVDEGREILENVPETAVRTAIAMLPFGLLGGGGRMMQEMAPPTAPTAPPGVAPTAEVVAPPPVAPEPAPEAVRAPAAATMKEKAPATMKAIPPATGKYGVTEAAIETYEEKAGVGACLPVAMVLRNRGLGQIEIGQYGPINDYIRSFPHYWIRTPEGEIIDPTNPFVDDEGLTYWDIEKIPSDEHPDPNLYRADDIAFWDERIKPSAPTPPTAIPTAVTPEASVVTEAISSAKSEIAALDIELAKPRVSPEWGNKAAIRQAIAEKEAEIIIAEALSYAQSIGSGPAGFDQAMRIIKEEIAGIGQEMGNRGLPYHAAAPGGAYTGIPTPSLDARATALRSFIEQVELGALPPEAVTPEVPAVGEVRVDIYALLGKTRAEILKETDYYEETATMLDFLENYALIASAKQSDATINRIFKYTKSRIIDKAVDNFNKALGIMKKYGGEDSVEHYERLIQPEVDGLVERFGSAKDRIEKVTAIDAFASLAHQHGGGEIGEIWAPMLFGITDYNDPSVNVMAQTLDSLAEGRAPIPPTLEGARPLELELYSTTRGFEEDWALREDLETNQGFKLYAVFTTPVEAQTAASDLAGQEIRFVKHISTTDVETWEVYAKAPEAPAPPTPPPGVRAPIPAEPIPPPTEMMSDLQDFEEMAGIAFKPDVWRTVANLPVIRNLMNVLGPSATANTPASQAMVGRAMLRHEGQQKTQGVISHLNRLGSQEQVFGKLDEKGLIAEGSLKGVAVNTIRTYPKRYTNKTTTAQKEWIAQAAVIEQEKLDFLKRNGIEVKELSFEEGGQYAGRRVFAKMKVTQGEPEVLQTGYVGAGPGRPGAKLAAEKHRIFKTEEEAIAEGFRYLPEDEALYLNVSGAYMRVADKQMADWLLFRVPWRTTAAPEELKLASYAAKQKLNKSRMLRAALNRAVRGERVPEITIHSIAAAYEPLANRLRSLIPRIQRGATTADEVQALTREATDLIKTNQVEWYKARSATARARELAMRPAFGEAMIPAPAFAGKILTGPEAKETAQIIKNSLAPGFNKALGAINKINAVSRFFMLAGDLSPMTIQLLFFMGQSPKIYGKAGAGMLKAIFDPEFHSNYLAKHNATIQDTRNLILTKSGATEFTEAMAKGGYLAPDRKILPAEERLIKKVPLLPIRAVAKAGAIVLQPFQRAFEAALDVAGIELRESLDYMCTTPERQAGVEQFINEFRGLTSSARIGVGITERQAESTVILAARYNRAIASLLFDVSRGNIRGELARKSLAKGITALAVLTVAISYAMGEDTDEVLEHLDPTSPMFMTWQVAGQKVGPGSKVRSVIKLFGQSAKDPEKLLELSMDNPGLRWIRGNFSPVVSTGYDLLTGRDYIGDPTREGLLSFTQTVAENFMPIWTQTFVLEGGTLGERAVRGAAEFTGMRGYPDPWGKLQGMKDEEARNRYNKPYDELNRLQQKQIEQTPGIKELQEQSEAESARRATGFRGEVDDFFAEGDRIEVYRSEKLWEIHDQMTRGAITSGDANSAYWSLGTEISGMYESRDIDPRYDKVREYLEETATEKEKEEEGKEVYPGDKAYYEYQNLFERADKEGWTSEIIGQQIEMLWARYPGAEDYVTQLQEVGKDWPPSYLEYRRRRGEGGTTGAPSLTESMLKGVAAYKATGAGPQQVTPVSPEATAKWQSVRQSLNVAMLRGLEGLWYRGEGLSPAVETQLKQVHQRHSFGQANFNAWLKQTLRQIFENAVMGK